MEYPGQPVSANDANYLVAAEGYSEENYNLIDGRIDTQSKLTPSDNTKFQQERSKNKRPSVTEKLKEKQAEVPEKSKADISLTCSGNDITLD